MTAQHLDEGTVQRLLHEELPDAQVVEVRAHLEGCNECRALVAMARREDSELFNRLRALDNPTPRVSWDQIVTRKSNAKHAGHLPRGAWRWAAGVLLAVGVSGVAYAAPGSPLRWVVARLTAWIRPPVQHPDSGPIAPTTPAGGGVMMDPGDGAVIELLSMQPFDTLRVTLGDGAQIAVRGIGGSVTFHSDVDRLSISNSSGVALIEVVLPRTAPRVEIVAGGRRLYVKEGIAITSVASDTTGGRHIILPSRR